MGFGSLNLDTDTTAGTYLGGGGGGGGGVGLDNLIASATSLSAGGEQPSWCVH